MPLSDYYNFKSISRTKSPAVVLAEAAEDNAGQSLSKVLTVYDVIAYGVGSTVGAGIFVTTGQGAASAGPAVVLSFTLASVACAFSAFSYSEFAARVPVSGSAYTYAYVCLGELAAWFIGWNLTLEYAISAAAVARTWSANLMFFLQQIGLDPPTWLNVISVDGQGITDSFSILATVIVLICTIILLIGVKESATFNLVITMMNISIILFIIFLGSFHVDSSNWTSPAPVNNIPTGCTSDASFTPCGVNGVITGAANVFFSYIGFDAVTTLAEEMKNPKKDLPVGVIATLLIATSLYVGACLVVTGMVPWYNLNHDTPLASAFKTVNLDWASTLIAAVCVTGLTATTLTSLFGQPRIFYRMAKDGLLFKPFAHLSARNNTPVVGTIYTGVAAGAIAFFLSLDALQNMISIGTLLAFSTVCAGVVLVRYAPTVPANPESLAPSVYNNDQEYVSPSADGPSDQLIYRPLSPSFFQSPLPWLAIYIVLCICFCVGLRNLSTWPLPLVIILGFFCTLPVFRIWYLPVDVANLPPANQFKCPYVPFVPCMGIFTNMYLIVSLDYLSYVRIFVWTLIGFSIYFGYGIFHSRLIKNSAYSNIADDDGIVIENRAKNAPVFPESPHVNRVNVI